MFIRRVTDDLTPAGGDASAVVRADHSIWRMLFVEPATATTTYDIRVEDKYGFTIYDKRNITGRLVDKPELPTFHNLTFIIDSASADEAFDYLFAFEETNV